MYFGKEVRILLKGQTKEQYLELKKRDDSESHTTLNSFYRVKDILLETPQHGNPIRKELIPRSFKKTGIQNLYREELSDYWRLLYTIESNPMTIYVFILSIMD